jgi:hypothetical protein
MWIYGIAGTGKTVLSAAAVQHLQQISKPKTLADSALHTSITIYFFCDHRDPEKRGFQDFLYTITKQLLDEVPQSFQDVKTWFKSRQPDMTTAKSITASEQTQLIRTICKRLTSVYLVVDALDECINPRDFIDGLKTLMAKSNLKTIITSRPEIDLERVLKPISGYLVDMQEHMWHDIQGYVQAEIDTRKASGFLKYRDDALNKEILKSIISQSDGM